MFILFREVGLTNVFNLYLDSNAASYPGSRKSLYANSKFGQVNSTESLA
jgi:hypothetical protein